MSRRRVIWISAAVLLLLAAAVGGYFLGASKAPGDEEAAALRDQAAARAFVVAQIGAYGQGFAHGLEAGEADGTRQGEQRGAAAGSDEIHFRLASKHDRHSGEKEATVQLDGDGEVLVVGDSLEVGTSPYLDRYLPGVRITSSAEVGYSSDQIFGLFQDNYDPSQSVIVFDAGTNDSPASPEILAGNLERVAGLVGDRCLVVPTIHSPTVGGFDDSGKNRVVRAFAAQNPMTEVPDWAQAAAQHPELIGPDDVHPTAAGYDYRAQLIAEGIEACLNSDAGLGQF